VVVGVNKFRDEETTTPALQRIDPSGEQRQVTQLQGVRAGRDGAAWQASLARLQDAARGDENLMPSIIEAVKAYATVGEICNGLRDVWGEHRELITV
jgi:methylmalonyl-CoA mutase N-terminal domain/subunit